MPRGVPRGARGAPAGCPGSKFRQRFRALLYRGRPLYTQGSGKGGRGVPRRGAPGVPRCPGWVPRVEISAKVPRFAVQGARSIHSRERQGRARGAPAGCPGRGVKIWQSTPQKKKHGQRHRSTLRKRKKESFFFLLHSVDRTARLREKKIAGYFAKIFASGGTGPGHRLTFKIRQRFAPCYTRGACYVLKGAARAGEGCPGGVPPRGAPARKFGKGSALCCTRGALCKFKGAASQK